MSLLALPASVFSDSLPVQTYVRQRGVARLYAIISNRLEHCCEVGITRVGVRRHGGLLSFHVDALQPRVSVIFGTCAFFLNNARNFLQKKHRNLQNHHQRFRFATRLRKKNRLATCLDTVTTFKRKLIWVMNILFIIHSIESNIKFI